MRTTVAFATLMAFLGQETSPSAEAVNRLIGQADAAARQGRMEEALALAIRAANLDDKNPAGPFFLGRLHGFLERHEEAVADFTRAIARDPRLAAAYDFRGAEQFKLARVAESLRDFDRAIDLQPAAGPGHWRRGISLYYAGRYQEGRTQFEESGRLQPNDIENALWRFLCAARAAGIEKARAEMGEPGGDPRVPMHELWALYRGRARADQVFAAARAGGPRPGELRVRLFFASLYVGLLDEVSGEAKQALEHVAQAAGEYRIAGYMGDVARVHQMLRTRSRR